MGGALPHAPLRASALSLESFFTTKDTKDSKSFFYHERHERHERL